MHCSANCHCFQQKQFLPVNTLRMCYTIFNSILLRIMQPWLEMNWLGHCHLQTPPRISLNHSIDQLLSCTVCLDFWWLWRTQSCPAVCGSGTWNVVWSPRIDAMMQNLGLLWQLRQQTWVVLHRLFRQKCRVGRGHVVFLYFRQQLNLHSIRSHCPWYHPVIWAMGAGLPVVHVSLSTVACQHPMCCEDKFARDLHQTKSISAAALEHAGSMRVLHWMRTVRRLAIMSPRSFV